MAFNTPKFNTPTFGNQPFGTTPLVVTTNLTNILSSANLDKQYEKIGKNIGFVNASFEAMMKSVGWQGGQAWCSYYVKLVFMQMFSFDRLWLSKNVSGSAMGNLFAIESLNNKGDKRYVAFRTNDVQVGDVFCLQGSKGGHTGIVTEILSKVGDGYKVKTIEGNTGASGTREGDKTAPLTRTLTIGQNSFGMILKGYWRRNFTQEEESRLKYDESQGTFTMEGVQISNPKSWINNPINPLYVPPSK